jgi:predicted nucleic acid-binding protein
MLAVTNTSPISNLAHIGRLDLLRGQSSKLWIPNAVEQELKRHPSIEALASIEAAYDDGWLCVGTPSETHLKLILLQQVHQGEAEAIALAVDSMHN